MSSTPVVPDVGGPTRAPGKGVSGRAALFGGVVAVAIVAVVLIAHALRGTPKAASPAAASSGMSATSTSGGSMSSTGGMATGSAAMGSSKVMTVSERVAADDADVGRDTGRDGDGADRSADWEGMSIEARTSAPATFDLFNGSSQQLVHPTAKTAST